MVSCYEFYLPENIFIGDFTPVSSPEINPNRVSGKHGNKFAPYIFYV